MGKNVALVTGTSSGLGISIAVQLAQKGYTVFASMRNLQNNGLLLAEAAKAKVTVFPCTLDVQNTKSIESCVKGIIDTEGKIDLLVNNAGSGFIKSTEQATEQEIQSVLDVNFMGVVRCTKAVIPFMRKARSGRVINITSVGGLVGQPFNEIYCAAKFAVEGYTESLACYVTPFFNIQFTAVEPGGITSEFANSILTKLSQNPAAADEYQPILKKYIDGSKARSAAGAYQSSDQVAEVVITCAENPKPPVRIRTSKWANDFCELKTSADPTGEKQRDHIFESFLKG